MNLAGLPMYDLPELRWATDGWWQALRRGFAAEGMGDIPAALDRELTAHGQWRRLDLIFGQSCGYPLTHEFASLLQPVATPCYAAAGCEGARYRSWVLVRDGSSAARLDQLAGAKVAINDRASQSGCNSLRFLATPLAKAGRFFGSVTETGNHLASIEAVRTGAADLAAIDCVTYGLLARHRPPGLFGTRIIAAGPVAPALPYVAPAAMSGATLEKLRRGLRRALEDAAAAEARAALLIADCAILPRDAYGVILEQERAAVRAGYAELA
jgi:ABC-type phosphate/phosphonate transport system substrate-binding protein